MDGQDQPPVSRLRATPDDGKRAPVELGHATALILRHGGMELRWFAPTEHDPQTPHDRDEIYFIAAGTGVFMRARDAAPLDDVSLPLRGEERVPFGPGDVLFVPAGTVHRFEQFSADFATWIVFYGPEGGEPD